MKNILVLIAIFLLVSCAHLNTARLNTKIDKLPFHSEKSTALYNVGKPFKIERIGGNDHWIYKVKKDGKEYTRTIIFKEGYSIKKTPLKTYPDPELLIEEADNFDEYEQAIEHYRKNKTN